MKPIQIGKLIFSKKALLTITFGSFCTGVILGALFYHSIKTESNFNFLLFFLFSIPIWILLIPKIKKEITS